MSFSTALCFSLTGTALLLALRPARSGWQPVLMTLLGGVVVGLGTVALSGYVTGVIRAYVWGQFTRMAIHTALGFWVLGWGVVALAWNEGRGDRAAAARRLPILLGLAVATATLCVWQALVVEESAQLDLIRHLEAANSRLPLSSLTRTQSLVPDGALWCGLVLSALLAWALHLALTARLRARETEAANGALRLAREELEVRVGERTAELALANQALRDVLLSVTEGKFVLCDGPGDLPPRPVVPAAPRRAVASVGPGRPAPPDAPGSRRLWTFGGAASGPGNGRRRGGDERRRTRRGRGGPGLRGRAAAWCRSGCGTAGRGSRWNTCRAPPWSAATPRRGHSATASG